MREMTRMLRCSWPACKARAAAAATPAGLVGTMLAGRGRMVTGGRS